MSTVNATSINKKMPSNAVKTISTRLGVVEYKSQDLFVFNSGLYGFENCKEFVLTFLPYEGTPENYRFLQSVEQPELAMIVMNIVVKDTVEAGLIAGSDLKTHLSVYDLKLEDIAVFLVVAIRSEDGKQRVSVNTKAPILLAPGKQLGWQVILDNSNYKVCHYLT
jgi:flagellar assembly factor FliW